MNSIIFWVVWSESDAGALVVVMISSCQWWWQGLIIICGQTLKPSKVCMIDGYFCYPLTEIVNVVCLIVAKGEEGQVNQHVMVACIIITVVVSSGEDRREWWWFGLHK